MGDDGKMKNDGHEGKEEKGLGKRNIPFSDEKKSNVKVMNEEEALKIELVNMKQSLMGLLEKNVILRKENAILSEENLKIRTTLLRFENKQTWKELGIGDGEWDVQKVKGKYIARKAEEREEQV